MLLRVIRLLTTATVLLTAATGCTTAASVSPSPTTTESHQHRPMMNFDQLEWTSFDGATFPFRYWKAERSATRALVVAVHGLNGSTRDFDTLAKKFATQGVTTLAYEMRGQGNDPEPRRIGDIRRTSDWKRDLHTFVALARQSHPDTPVFLFGESLGALIAVHSLTSLPEPDKRIAGLMLASPVVTLKGKISLPKQLALQIGALMLPRYQLPFTDLSGQSPEEMMVTSDASLHTSSEQTPWLVSEFSLRFIATVGRMVNGMIPRAPRITSPTLVLSGHKDVVMNPDDIQRFVDALPDQLTTHVDYPEGHHLLLYDNVSQSVIDDTCHWLDAQLELLESSSPAASQND
ncbi:alpha/beta fold hydrolase [Sulfuriroseicoccus oceanibius]|uniref:Alpha/beta fold hydrolase n=1 Tax=Sulfuriroseicoccus oceanibius TaxID=2707525 RepID=A0A6B3LBH1_9BACT|nr:alpha/beta fold hydrolase [Sulfuriroseicoccus oceanibius]QQL45480.1 alpha/beta fold hydrolase [Sulfuriroseicoccus oceanibius]